MPKLPQINQSSHAVRRLLSTTEAGRYLGLSPSAVRRLIYAHEFPVIRRFGAFKIDTSDLDDFIVRQKALY